MRLPALSRIVLLAGAAACLATWLFGARLPYFDYDDATQGIFVNDLTFHHDVDFSFEGRTDRQNIYRASFATQRLTYSLPLSWVQRALHLPKWRVEDLLRTAALLFAGAGALLAAIATRRGKFPFSQQGGIRGALQEKGNFPLLAAMAAMMAHPSLALFARSGASFYVFAFAVFWLGVLASFRWVDGGKVGWAYLTAFAVMLSVLNPYPPLLCWPLAAIAYAIWQRRWQPMLRDRHLYLAAGTALLGALIVMATSAWSAGLSLPELLVRQAAFRADRGGAVALSQLAVSPVDKMAKLVDQHLLSRVDRLGDASRDDSIWVLGTTQPVILLWAAAAIFGLWIALRRRDGGDRRVLAVTGMLLAIFLTISFPEGRYVLALLPCWVYFALRGVTELPLKASLKAGLLGILLLLTAAGTERAIRRTFVPKARAAWSGYEGMTAAAPLAAALPDDGAGLRVLLPYPVTPFSELRFRMVMPDGAVWLPRQDADRILSAGNPGFRMAALDYADRPDRIQALEARGFSGGTSLQGEASGRPMLFLIRTP